MELLSGLTVTPMKENSKAIISRDMVGICGLMGGSTKGFGGITK